MDTDDATKPRLGRPPKRYDGKTIREWAAYFGVDYYTVHRQFLAEGRLADGETEPARRRRTAQSLAIDACIERARLGDAPTATQADIARAFGISRAAVSLREKRLRAVAVGSAVDAAEREPMGLGYMQGRGAA